VASFGEAWPGLRRPQGDHLLRLRSGPGASVLNNRREAASFCTERFVDVVSVMGLVKDRR